jgi:uncharacterized membrane protein
MAQALIPPEDLLALAVFVLAWVVYSLFSGHARWSSRNLTSSVNLHRVRWMRRLVERDMRMSDASLVANLMRSVSFFASTSIIILGALLALFGSVERGMSIISELPFAAAPSRTLFELKLVSLTIVFIYAFFQFTWSLRQFNYFSIAIGGAPEPRSDEVSKTAWAKQAARLAELAARSFNDGLRAYYFALAMLGWFISPWVFMASSLLVVLVLYRREFLSRTLHALRDG